MKIAIIQDFLNQYGGAERVIESLKELYPAAPIFTSIFLPKNLPASFGEYEVRTSFMQRLPFMEKHFKNYLLLYQRAIESFDLSGFDTILSSSSAFAKGAIPQKGVCHICYCYSPMRFVWEYQSYIKYEKINPFYKLLLPFAIRHLKKWDLKTIKRVHYFVAISNYVRQKIKAFYGREADIIYPPVKVSFFEVKKKCDDFYLVVSRLNGYKRIDVAIEAFNKLGVPLLVVGTGPLEAHLKGLAAGNISFLGKVSEEDLRDLLSNCKGLIFPGKEDFGIAPVESMASGRPVIAYAAGGALETVLDGITGVFFKRQTPESLYSAVLRFEKISFDPFKIRKHAENFDEEVFKSKISKYIEEKNTEFRSFS
jgi:glycosyltransferase involved in cell wall biosynthesis